MRRWEMGSAGGHGAGHDDLEIPVQGIDEEREAVWPVMKVRCGEVVPGTRMVPGMMDLEIPVPGIDE